MVHDDDPLTEIASGVVGDNKINRHNTCEVGIVSITKISGQTFNNNKLKCADNVHILSTMSSTIKVYGKMYM